MRIVVNHLTRMRPGYICVAGLDVTTGQHIRPVLGGASLGTMLLRRHGGPFDLACTVDLGRAVPVGHAPEVEDVRFERSAARRLDELAPAAFWALLERAAQPTMRAIFGPDLHLYKRGAVVPVGAGQASLGCLRVTTRPDLVLNGEGRLRLLLTGPARPLDLAVTDLRLYDYADGQYTPRTALVTQVAGRIAAGVGLILSMGLGRPFQGLDDPAPQHWLQVNNLHLEDDPVWRLK